MIYKRLTISFVFALLISLSLFNFASAHVLQTDGSIGAIMHIDPDDDPIVGQPANFFFEFQDSSSKFKTQDCNCTASISENGKQLYFVQLFKDNSTADFVTSLFSFSFPEKAVYAVEVKGQPKTAGEFQPFTLDYNVRVDREADSNQQISQSANQPTNHIFHYVIFGLAFLIILFLYVKEKRRQKDPKNPGAPKSTILPILAAVAMTGFLVHGSMIDTALCMHDHPLMSDHQCCVAPQAIAVSAVALQTQSTFVKVALQNFIPQSKQFFLQENNKSPPL